jgi:uncharacterized hydrophobic protein (TIGR00271 family)
MLLLRIVAPPDLVPGVLAHLDTIETCDLIHFPKAGRKPAGDFIQCVVNAEHASVVVSVLRELGVAERGSITLDRLDATVSVRHTESDSDAVVWEELEAKTSAMASLSTGFLVYLMAATVIAAVGILTDSVVLIIGAMVVGPEMGPLAGLSVGIIQRRREMVRRSLITLTVGFALAFAASFLVTWAFRGSGVAPAVFESNLHPATIFISRPDAYSVVIAAICGVVGMLSLTTASSGTLIGVLISVTTIPAAGNFGVAAAYGNTEEMWGSLIQLGVNVGVIQIAGLITLRIQRFTFASRVSAYVEKLGHLRFKGRIKR